MKKNTDHLTIVQKDLQTCVQEFQKVKNEFQKEAEDKSNNKILKKNKKRIKPSASTTNAYVLAMLTANTHQVGFQLIWLDFIFKIFKWFLIANFYL